MDIKRIRPLKSSKFRCFILLTLILILYTVENFSPNYIKTNITFIYILKPSLWLITIFIVLSFPKLRAWGKIRLNDMLMWTTVLLGGAYIGIMVICGMVVGFGRSPFDHSITGILINILLIFPALIGREMVRSYLVKSTAKKNYYLSIAIISLLFTFLNMSPELFTKLGTKLDILKLFGETFLPELCNNIFASYLVFLGSPLLSIIYLGMQQAFYWFSPIMPNINWITKALIGTLCPFFSLTYLKYFYSMQSKEIKRASDKTKNPLIWALVTTVSILTLWFVIGVFPVRPYAIATGSMEPLIQPGDVVLVEKTEAEKLRIGDIIQYKKDNIFIFHRVIDVVKEDNQTRYKTKGDNNSAADGELVETKNIKGKVIKTIPKIGWPTILLRSNKNLDKSQVEF